MYDHVFVIDADSAVEYTRLALRYWQTDGITLYSVVPPRLAEDIIWRHRFPSRCHARKRSRRPTPPPGVGRFLFLSDLSSACAGGHYFPR